VPGWDSAGQPTKDHLGDGYIEHAVEGGFALAMAPNEGHSLTGDGFVARMRNMLGLVLFADHHKVKLGPHIVDYALAAARVRAPVEILGQMPIGPGLRPLVDLERWTAILQQVADRDPNSDEQWVSLWRACLDLHLRANRLDHDYTNPCVMSLEVHLAA